MKPAIHDQHWTCHTGKGLWHDQIPGKFISEYNRPSRSQGEWMFRDKAECGWMVGHCVETGISVTQRAKTSRQAETKSDSKGSKERSELRSWPMERGSELTVKRRTTPRKLDLLFKLLLPICFSETPFLSQRVEIQIFKRKSQHQVYHRYLSCLLNLLSPVDYWTGNHLA